MKKFLSLTFFLLVSIVARGQHEGGGYDSGQDGHDASGHTHDHAPDASGHTHGHSHDDHGGNSHSHEDHNPFDFSGLVKEVYGDGEHSVTHRFVGVAPRFGLAFQRNLYAEAGLSLDIYRIGYTEASEYVTFRYSNLRPYISGEILVSDRNLLGGGKAGLEFIMSSTLFGMAAGLDGSFYTDRTGAEAWSITPRLMLSFVYVEIFYGYNIFIRNELRPWLGPHRFGVSFTLNPRFWKRKKRIAEDYYDSYVQ